MSFAGFGQGPELTDKDKKEIKFLARHVVQTGLKDLLNSLASTNFGEGDKRAMIYDSYMTSTNQVFYSGSTLIEDDVNPENTIAKSGPDLTVQKYLEDLKIFYSKSDAYTIRITEVSVGEVQQKEYPYVQVTFKIHFTNSHRQKETKYAPVVRVAELRADKPDKDWIVMITRIGYYRAPAVSPAIAAAPVVTNNTAVPAQKPVEPKPAAAPAPQAKENKPQVAENKPVTPPAETKKSPEPTVANSEKKEVPVTDLKKPDVPVKTEQPTVADKKAEVPQAKKEEPAAVAKAPAPEPKKEEARKTAEAQPKKEERTAQKPKENVAPAAGKGNSAQQIELASLEKRAAKYQNKANLARIGAGVVIVASVATAAILINGYSDYKSQVDRTNQQFRTWWETTSGSSTNGAGFGSIDGYQAKPKSVLSYSSPGIYAAGAGVIVGGVLWFIGSSNAREAKKLKKLAQQRRERISVTPQWSGAQNYAGLQLRYQF